MDWKINGCNVVALWALFVMLFSNKIVFTYQEKTSELDNSNNKNDTGIKTNETTTGNVLENNNITNNHPQVVITKNNYKNHNRNRKRGRDLKESNNILHNKNEHYSSHYQHEQLMKKLRDTWESSSSSTVGISSLLSSAVAREHQVVTYDALKNILRTFLFQNLPMISPNVLKYARQARGKKKKYKKFILPMIMGALLVKSLILPIILKGLAVLSSKAVMLSMVSLLVASLSSLKRGARHDTEKTEVQVIHVPVKHSGYKRHDDEHEEIHEEHYHHHDDDYGSAHHYTDPHYYHSHHRRNHERAVHPEFTKGIK